MEPLFHLSSQGTNSFLMSPKSQMAKALPRGGTVDESREKQRSQSPGVPSISLPVLPRTP